MPCKFSQARRHKTPKARYRRSADLIFVGWISTELGSMQRIFVARISVRWTFSGLLSEQRDFPRDELRQNV
jgi:hypothetical protein